MENMIELEIQMEQSHQFLIGPGNTCLLCGAPGVTEDHECFEAQPGIPLPPCPFCGGTDILYCPDYSQKAMNRAKCKSCHATALESVWRVRRATEEVIQARIAEMQSSIG